MFIQHSIVAGRILSLLEKTNRSVSFEELQDYLKESMDIVKGGVSQLIREGLAVIDIDENLIPKVALIPDFDGKKDSQRSRKEFYLAGLFKKGVCV